MLQVKVLGVGCPRCQHLESEARNALSQAGIPFELVKVTDLEEILNYQVHGLPALVLNGVVVSAGKIPRPEHIVELAIEYGNG